MPDPHMSGDPDPAIRVHARRSKDEEARRILVHADYSGRAATVRISGEMTGTTLPVLRGCLVELPARPLETILLDLSEVRLISPSGLRWLIALRRHCARNSCRLELRIYVGGPIERLVAVTRLPRRTASAPLVALAQGDIPGRGGHGGR
jgi:anti-anti-sigma factor